MKKLLIILAAIIISSCAMSQTYTFRATSALITETGTWDDMEPLDLTGQGVFVFNDTENGIIKVTNKSRSVFFIASRKDLPDYVDEDGDVRKTVTYKCYDQDGDECTIGIIFWDGDVAFADGSDLIMRVIYPTYMLDYKLKMLN